MKRSIKFYRRLLSALWLTFLPVVAQATSLTAAVRENRSVVVESRSSRSDGALAPKQGPNYVFDPEVLNKLGTAAREKFETKIATLTTEELTREAGTHFRKVLGGYTQDSDLRAAYRFEMIAKYLREALRATFGNKILEKSTRVVNNVGGAYAIMEIYYCSATEYLAVFGSPLKQSAYSGHYPFMDVYDVMVDGQMKSHGFSSDDSVLHTYDAGDTSLLIRKDRRYYTMEPGAMMIDYGRGFILPAFWPGVIAPALFSSYDLPSLGGQVGDCARSFLNRVRG